MCRQERQYLGCQHAIGRSRSALAERLDPQDAERSRRIPGQLRGGPDYRRSGRYQRSHHRQSGRQRRDLQECFGNADSTHMPGDRAVLLRRVRRQGRLDGVGSRPRRLWVVLRYQQLASADRAQRRDGYPSRRRSMVCGGQLLERFRPAVQRRVCGMRLLGHGLGVGRNDHRRHDARKLPRRRRLRPRAGRRCGQRTEIHRRRRLRAFRVSLQRKRRREDVR